MHDGEHDDAIRLDGVEQSVRKSLQQQAPDAGVDLEALLRRVGDAVERCENLGLEAFGHVRVARGVPQERFVGLALCFCREDEKTARHLSLG
ncbi:hypothetical protein WMF24_19315 [Sorangium sp. So ce1335]